MIVFSINPQKSSTLGGVESLIRQLHGLDNITEFYEFYEHERNADLLSYNLNVKYIKFGYDRLSLKNKILTKLRLAYLLNSYARPDFIFIYHPNDILYIPLWILKKTKVVLVQTNKFNVFFKGVSKFVMRFYYKSIWAFTVYTEKDKEVLLSLYPSLNNIVKVIPRGCKLETSTSPVAMSKKLVTICRIDNHQKNFKAMNLILKDLPSDYNLDIYGDGTIDEISNLKFIIGNNKKIRFMGPTNDVKTVLRKYSLFIMTSNYEGFGQSLIEARSQGLPIVAYNTFDALSWIVDDGINGYCIDPNDQNDFIDKICSLTSDANIFNKTSENALNKAKETEASAIKEMWECLIND